MNRFEILNQVHTNRIIKTRKENYRVKTIEIEHNIQANPGQFIMVWVPGIGERPMSIGNDRPLTISVANVGKVSSGICSLGEGDLISYRGPFGSEFRIAEDAKSILCIGGGYGIVPMYFLSKRAREMGIDCIAVIGARNEKDIVYEDQLFAVCKQVYLTTDDGSKGRKGTVMAEAGELITKKHVDAAYCCGPEKMMHAIATLCKEHSVPCQVSIERRMKCAVGICGSCAINGRLACLDGPVFTGEEAISFSEFGK